jgi:hypothetical protein
MHPGSNLARYIEKTSFFKEVSENPGTTKSADLSLHDTP